jgi:hypothetical protein
MKSLLVFMSISLLIISCTDRDDELSAANIRIRNVSSIVFDEVQVGDHETLHLDVAPAEFSEYLAYNVAYRFAFISIQAGEETFVLQPMDYVGETELPTGLYTYELNISAEGTIILEFVAD